MKSRTLPSSRPALQSAVRRRAALTLALVTLAATAPPVARAIGEVSAQGLFTTPPGAAVSPAGTYRLEYTLSAAAENRLLAEIVVSAVSSGAQDRWRLHAIPGPAFFISDAGRIVALESFDPPEIPASVRVYDLEGRLLHTERLRVATDPCLSPDGAALLCRTADGVVRLDLRTFEKTWYPRYGLFAPGTGGRLAGMMPGGPLEVHGFSAQPLVIPVARDGPREAADDGAVSAPARMAGDPIRLAWSADGAAVLVLEPRRLVRIHPRTLECEVLFAAPEGEELRDLRVSHAGTIELALRIASADRSTGWYVALAPAGEVLGRREGPTMRLPLADFSAREAAPPAARVAGRPSARDGDRPTPSIPWPLAPNTQHPVGNTYNEYQNYGGAAYPHPGVDVLGTGGQPVFAVHAGVVKAVLTTGGDLYWRVAIADTVGNGTLPGYLYAHLERSSIPVTVGQQILAGQYLGDLVDWPIPDFTHIHFARIQSSGTQWYGAWLSIDNPQIYLQNQSEDLAPVFEPAVGNALLAFCANETSSYQSPSALHGAVDIVAHVGDRIVSDYVCTVQELRYTIYPVAHPGTPVVDDMLAVFFDMENDFYTGGSGYALLTNILYKQDATCPTQGDYDRREFFHILTNSDGDGEWGTEDQLASWDTSVLPDGRYVIRVVASDVAGNVATDSMTVETVNGNFSSLAGEPTDGVLLQGRPTLVLERAAIRFALPRAGHVSLNIHDLSGRRVRSLLDAELPGGFHEIDWDGRGEAGAPVPGGIYFYRLSGPSGAGSGRLVLPR